MKTVCSFDLRVNLSMYIRYLASKEDAFGEVGEEEEVNEQRDT